MMIDSTNVINLIKNCVWLSPYMKKELELEIRKLELNKAYENEENQTH